MDTNNQAIKSLQNLSQNSFFLLYSSGRSKSLPNIFFSLVKEDCGSATENKPFNGQESIKKHHHQKPKILKKTWDKVKTAIIHSTSAHSYRRCSLRNKLETPSSLRPSAVSSAPSTPLHKKSFDFDNQRVGTYALEGSSTQSTADSNNGFPLANTQGIKNVLENEKVTESPANKETEKIQRNYAQLQKRLSEELHQRMSEYKPEHHKNTTENLSEDFRKKLQQWEMWKLSTGKVTYTDEELQQLLPEDFSKKLHEWESIKTSGISPHNLLSTEGSGPGSSRGGHQSRNTSKTPDSSSISQTTRRGTSSPETPSSTSNKAKLLRKKKNSDSSRQKELAWLEKQLEKIEVEKKRLEREMKKYVEREARLEKMKQALQNTSSTEVWIRTPTANCKVEKLTEKFTKKLYEWEEKQGIQPESSTMALLHPKYYGPPPDEYDNEEYQDQDRIDRIEVENRVRTEFDETRYDDDTPAFSSRESESRQDECEEGGCCDVDELQQDVEEHGMSSASSSDFEEATDSFATHDKGNSGASNTDSDFYRAEFPGCRRRSSEANSTPLSARSPSLSAFTSDDEGEMCGLLKTVSEENENLNTLKDAESQTEVIVKAKPVVVEDEDDNEDILGDESQAGIFVPTKRTIFTPILVDESESEKVVLIEQDLKSPSLVKSILQNSNPSSFSFPAAVSRSQSQENEGGIRAQSPVEPAKDLTGQTTQASTITQDPSPRALPRPPPPRIVEVTPKLKSNNLPLSSPPITQQRPFPKMGKIPVWCSPLGTRRHLGGGVASGSNVMGSGDLNETNVRAHSSSVDFTIDRFLLDSNLFGKSPGESQGLEASAGTSSSTSRIPIVTPRLGRRNTSAAVIEESGITGASVQTGQRHLLLPTRSSSFRFQRDPDRDATIRPSHYHKLDNSPQPETSKGLYSHIRNRVGSVVTKSQSTGSIKSKLGKAFTNFTHKITGDRDRHQLQTPQSDSEPSEPQLSPEETVTSSSDQRQPQPSTSRKLSGWLPGSHKP